MPIGLVSDEEMQREIDSYTKSVPSVPRVEIMDRPGRDKGDVNVPESLRKIIGETGLLDSREAALQIARQFGISDSSVSAYTKGATSTTTYQTPKASLVEHLNKSRRRAIIKAGKTLNGALSAITQEKLDYTDAKDLSAIAKNMSAVIKDLEPQQVPTEIEGKSSPQFVIFAPTFRDERSFETITVQE